MSTNPSPSSSITPPLSGCRRSLERRIQDHLGLHLRRAYQRIGLEPVPKSLEALAAHLDRLMLDDAGLSEFRDSVLETRPILRAFAISLTKNSDRADDLVQDTLLRAFDKQAFFQPGTNLNAWLFTILRNRFFSDHRGRAREVADSDGDYAAQLSVFPEQIDKLDIQDLQSALTKLDPDQRKALLLVGAHGFSYEEASIACSAPIGTIKSRVNRARARLADLLGYTSKDVERDRFS